MPFHYDSGRPLNTDQVQYLPDVVYGQALDCKVLNSTDLFPVFHNEAGTQVLLGRRTHEPMQGWWVFGGDHAIRTSPQLSLALKMQLEMGLDFDPERFIYLDSASMSWPIRAQASTDSGCHRSSWFYSIALTDAELKNIKLNDEYSESKLVNIQQLIAGEYHPVLQFMASVYVAQYDQKLRSLQMHSRECKRVRNELILRGYKQAVASAAVEAAGLPMLAEISAELVESARPHMSPATLGIILIELLGNKSSSPEIIAALQVKQITPPPGNLSPEQIRGVIRAALRLA